MALIRQSNWKVELLAQNWNPPHVVFVSLTGFRVCDEEIRELGMNLPGFEQRAAAIAELPALGLLTPAVLDARIMDVQLSRNLKCGRGLRRADSLGTAGFGCGFGPHGV